MRMIDVTMRAGSTQRLAAPATFAGSIQIPSRRDTRSDIPKIHAITWPSAESSCFAPVAISLLLWTVSLHCGRDTEADRASSPDESSSHDRDAFDDRIVEQTAKTEYEVTSG